MPDLKELLERVKAATGPDHTLDGLIWGALVAEPPCVAPAKVGVSVPTYTASLDAAHALVERCLPGWRRSIYERAPGSWEAALGLNYSGRADDGPHRVVTGKGANGSLALLSTLLSALQKGEGQ